jgi:hypothetical protein
MAGGRSGCRPWDVRIDVGRPRLAHAPRLRARSSQLGFQGRRDLELDHRLCQRRGLFPRSASDRNDGCLGIKKGHAEQLVAMPHPSANVEQTDPSVARSKEQPDRLPELERELQSLLRSGPDGKGAASMEFTSRQHAINGGELRQQRLGVLPFNETPQRLLCNATRNKNGLGESAPGKHARPQVDSRAGHGPHSDRKSRVRDGVRRARERYGHCGR